MAVTISDLYTYPLKSGAGVAMDTIELTDKGPKNDRLWSLMHAEGPRAGIFISQRDRGCEKLTLIQTVIHEQGYIEFIAPDKSSITLNPIHLTGEIDSIRIHGDDCEGVDAGDNVANWFSNYLGTPCRLMHMPDHLIRTTDPLYSMKGDQVGFADGFPLLITNTSSLESLQSHFSLGENISMNRFRPNIVLDGIDAFEEDVIHKIKIGNVILEFMKPCSRCKLTTVDQGSGVMVSKEPLATLSKMRRGKADGLAGVFFGQNATPRALGSISVGDEVKILSKKPMHPALDQAVLKIDI